MPGAKLLKRRAESKAAMKPGQSPGQQSEGLSRFPSPAPKGL